MVVDRGSHFHWGLFKNGVCVMNVDPVAAAGIERLDFKTNVWKTLSRLPKNTYVNEGGPSLSVSPDGRWIIFVAAERLQSDIMIIENFRLPS